MKNKLKEKKMNYSSLYISLLYIGNEKRLLTSKQQALYNPHQKRGVAAKADIKLKTTFFIYSFWSCMEAQIKITKEKNVLTEWGKSFVKIPRKIIDRMFSAKTSEHRLGLVHFTLLAYSFHTDGYASLDGKPVLCRRGEYIGSSCDLGSLTHLPQSSVRYILKKLREEGWIELKAIEGGYRIQVNGYHEFMGKEPGQKSKKKNEEPSPATPADALANYLGQFKESV